MRFPRLVLAQLVVFPLALAIAVCPLGSTPSTDSLFLAPELLCVIEHYRDAGPDGARGKILCASESPGIDFLFLGTKWYDSLMDLPDCDCDLDFDTYTGCEEILLCINPATNDTDGDCLADNLEIFLGLDPTEADSDRDGVLDGDEDPDEDGRTIGDDDEDSDGLTNCQEGTIGTNPVDPDTDDDGYSDGTEILTDTLQPLSDPLDPLSVPDLFFAGAQQVRINLTGNGGDLPAVTNMAGNPVGIYAVGGGGDVPTATELAQPRVTVEISDQP
jgi:hypothetical protein